MWRHWRLGAGSCPKLPLDPSLDEMQVLTYCDLRICLSEGSVVSPNNSKNSEVTEPLRRALI